MAKAKPRLYRILLLEDDLEAAGKLLLALGRIEPHLAPFDLDVTLLSTSDAVKELVNAHPGRRYGIILMDRDCKMNGSFHVLDDMHFTPENVISISSTPMWNHVARDRGAVHVIPKSFGDLDGFAERVAQQVLEMLQGKARQTPAAERSSPWSEI
ncbi:MAG: hypothetical protein KDJ55_14195 [Rhodobiaceae bacterium]|nr:hypothetical protein [Rhodobiaceae bacterium]MCC0018889.1 hypothetical protein [Rhodobiaceae bacterium]MCC0051220.1 hypothetical protein [Rhodobiaceae bacterium]MCC0059931.1 hypothetical protein [Rhodobiaceae bacterium]